MVNTNLLRAEIIKQGKKPQDMYKVLGISRRMWYIRLEKKEFSSTEILKLKDELKLTPKDTCDIFFGE